MKLELVSHTLCPYVHRAAAMIHEKGVPFERRIHRSQGQARLVPGHLAAREGAGAAGRRPAAVRVAGDHRVPRRDPSAVAAGDAIRSSGRASAHGSRSPTISRMHNTGSSSRRRRRSKRRRPRRWRPIPASYEEALGRGVIAPEGFGLAHLALASSALRFAIVEAELGVGCCRRRRRSRRWFTAWRSALRLPRPFPPTTPRASSEAGRAPQPVHRRSARVWRCSCFG